MVLQHELVNGDLVTYHGKNYQVCDIKTSGCYAMTLISPKGVNHIFVPHEAVEFVKWTGKRNPKVK